MVLHTSMEIIEHHHHDGLDLFPDYNRQIPFGTGTSILYNYLDYRFKNNTDITYQLITYTTDEYLCGEIRANKRQEISYHIKSENEHFIEESGLIFRQGQVYRECMDIKTGNCIERELICNNHAKVMYDTTNLVIVNNSVK
jgi:vancomycin resistance protein VanW